MNEPLAVGKLPPDVLTDLLTRHGARSRRVLTPPAVGEDAAAILTSLPCTVVAMDPVAGSPERIGTWVVHRNANDVATRGAEPCWFLFTLLLPVEHAMRDTIADIFRQVDDACKSVGAELIGGHTEISEDIRRPIAVGTMIGEITTFRLTSTRSARPGNAIVMVGACGDYGAAILATEHADELRRRGVSDPVLEEAARFLDSPHLSIVPAARVAMRAAHPQAMHDPTHGGIATALHELARAAGVRIEIEASAISIRPQTDEICQRAGVDPWGAMSSGTLLVCVDPVDVEPLVTAYQESGIEARRIGTVCEGEAGVTRREADGTVCEVGYFERDEVLRFARR